MLDLGRWTPIIFMNFVSHSETQPMGMLAKTQNYGDAPSSTSERFKGFEKAPSQLSPSCDVHVVSLIMPLMSRLGVKPESGISERRNQVASLGSSKVCLF